jgi:membrane protease YdiL (CAAX protease family)
MLAGAEVALATVLVLGDVLVPAVLLLAVAALSLAVRRERPASLGFARLARPGRVAGQVLVLTAGWSVLQLGLVMPVLEHLTGHRQDLSAFEDLQGDAGLLAGLVLASWTLGTVEETVFRGYLPSRVTELLGSGPAGVVAAVLVSSVLFGLIHTEQGVVGVVVTFFDALYFSWLRHRHGSVWAAVLGHGSSNTIGLVTFFLVGPVYGLW